MHCIYLFSWPWIYNLRELQLPNVERVEYLGHMQEYLGDIEDIYLQICDLMYITVRNIG